MRLVSRMPISQIGQTRHEGPANAVRMFSANWQIEARRCRKLDSRPCGLRKPQALCIAYVERQHRSSAIEYMQQEVSNMQQKVNKMPGSKMTAATNASSQPL
jgi:hypothetical protein